MIDVSVSTTFVADDTPLQEALKQCQNVGIKSVEIGSNHCYEEHYDYLHDYNFQYLVHNYFPIPQISFVLNIASIDEQIRTLSLQHVKKALDLCEKTDAKLYTFHPGFLTDPKGSNQSNINYDFQWEQNQLSHADHDKAKDLMYQALDEIVKYAASKEINISIETEGSVKKKNHLLMQQPHEFEEFMTKYKVSDIGINLNIGHLNLAANAFEFDRHAFVDLVKDHIVAMELSHNDGVEDQHLPLRQGEWYWDIINDRRFEDAFKILEFRNTQIAEIARNVQLIRGNNNEFSVSG